MVVPTTAAAAPVRAAARQVSTKPAATAATQSVVKAAFNQPVVLVGALGAAGGIAHSGWQFWNLHAAQQTTEQSVAAHPVTEEIRVAAALLAGLDIEEGVATAVLTDENMTVETVAEMIDGQKANLATLKDQPRLAALLAPLTDALDALIAAVTGRQTDYTNRVETMRSDAQEIFASVAKTLLDDVLGSDKTASFADATALMTILVDAVKEDAALAKATNGAEVATAVATVVVELNKVGAATIGSVQFETPKEVTALAALQAEIGAVGKGWPIIGAAGGVEGMRTAVTSMTTNLTTKVDTLGASLDSKLGAANKSLEEKRTALTTATLVDVVEGDDAAPAEEGAAPKAAVLPLAAEIATLEAEVEKVAALKTQVAALVPTAETNAATLAESVIAIAGIYGYTFTEEGALQKSEGEALVAKKNTEELKTAHTKAVALVEATKALEAGKVTAHQAMVDAHTALVAQVNQPTFAGKNGLAALVGFELDAAVDLNAKADEIRIALGQLKTATRADVHYQGLAGLTICKEGELATLVGVARDGAKLDDMLVAAKSVETGDDGVVNVVESDAIVKPLGDARVAAYQLVEVERTVTGLDGADKQVNGSLMVAQQEADNKIASLQANGHLRVWASALAGLSVFAAAIAANQVLRAQGFRTWVWYPV